MERKSTTEKISILKNVYFKGQYDPSTHSLNELNLLHAKQLTGLGGEQTLNDANTKKQIGISDFVNTQVPSDATGLISAIAVEYGSHTPESGGTAETNPALIEYSPLASTMPTWLKNSELVLKSKGAEQFRVRVSELAVLDKPRVVPSAFAKELERTLKVQGNQDLQLFLATPDGATLTSGKSHFIRVNLYGIKFATRER
jgi:hypothetical protein